MPQLLLRVQTVFFNAGATVAGLDQPADRLMILVSGRIKAQREKRERQCQRRREKRRARDHGFVEANHAMVSIACWRRVPWHWGTSPCRSRSRHLWIQRLPPEQDRESEGEADAEAETEAEAEAEAEAGIAGPLRRERGRKCGTLGTR